MELIKVGEKTYYLENATNIGVYKINDNDVFIIDTGNDKDTGKKIIKTLELANLQIKGIINTHSHADHIGGNELISKRTNALIYTSEIEKYFTRETLLEPSLLYGGYPFQELKNKFLCASKSNALDISNLPLGLSIFSLKGHSPDMLGVKTSDDIYFLGDALVSEETINKYQIFYIYNVLEYLNTLEYLETLKGKLFIASHGVVTKDINKLITLNRLKIEEIAQNIVNICEEEKTLEEIVQAIFKLYNLNMNLNQYYLISSTIKAYISYLKDLGKLDYLFKNNLMYWYQVKEGKEYGI